MRAYTNTYEYYKQMHDLKKKSKKKIKKYMKFFKINFKIVQTIKNCNYDNKKKFILTKQKIVKNIILKVYQKKFEIYFKSLKQNIKKFKIN